MTMNLTGTVVTPQDEVEMQLMLGVPVVLLGVAVWSAWRWRKRWWGWPVAVGCVAVLGWLTVGFLKEREEAIAARREVDSEFRLMMLRSRMVGMRVSTREMREADAETLVRAMVSNMTSVSRSHVNDAGELLDAWGNPLRIEVGEEIGDVKVSSAGRDGRFGTTDDLSTEE